jgi:hypothetical protein
MTLIATMTFGDEDPDLHVHFTRHAHDLDDNDPVEFARVLRTLEEACTAYSVRLYRARQALELRLTTEDEQQEATSG